MNHALATSDSLEHLLRRLAADVEYIHNKDVVMYNEVRTGKPPGEASLMPEWERTRTRDASKAVYQQRARASGPKGPKDFSSSDDGGKAEAKKAARARRRAEAKKKAALAEQGAKGGGKAGAPPE